MCIGEKLGRNIQRFIGLKPICRLRLLCRLGANENDFQTHKIENEKISESNNLMTIWKCTWIAEWNQSVRIHSGVDEGYQRNMQSKTSNLRMPARKIVKVPQNLKRMSNVDIVEGILTWKRNRRSDPNVPFLRKWVAAAAASRFIGKIQNSIFKRKAQPAFCRNQT